MIKSCFWAWARPVRLAVAGSEAKGAGPCAGLLRASLAPRRAEHDAAMGVGGQNQSLGAAAGLLRWECSTGARHGLALALRTRRGPLPAGRRRCALMSERASGSTRAFSPAEARPAARASDGCLRGGRGWDLPAVHKRVQPPVWGAERSKRPLGVVSEGPAGEAARRLARMCDRRARDHAKSCSEQIAGKGGGRAYAYRRDGMNGQAQADGRSEGTARRSSDRPQGEGLD